MPFLPRISPGSLALFLALSLFALPLLHAEEIWTVTPLSKEQEIKLDGVLDEAAWQGAPSFDKFYQTYPVDLIPAPYKTSIKIAKDGKYLYIGAYVFDDDPELRSAYARRDHIADSNDSLWITIDPLGSGTFGQVFAVNPDCSINDGLFNESKVQTDMSTDFDFQVACQKQADGWSVEYQIPLREFRFADSDSNRWRIFVQRIRTRDQYLGMANAPMKKDPNCYLCIAPTLTGIAPLPDPQFFVARPYAIAREIDTPANEVTRKRSYDVGLDLKYRLSSDSIFDATINPDFSQVNLDEPQLTANTRFAVYFPENRNFFMEGSDLLDTTMKIISTRSIATPSWGLKFTQRSQEYETIILSGDDQKNSYIIVPGTFGSRFVLAGDKQKYLISRTRWSGEGFNLGLSFTVRDYDGKGSNSTFGPDLLLYLNETDSVKFQSILSLTSNALNPSTRLLEKTPSELGNATAMTIQHNGRFWKSTLELKNFDEKFRSDLGFNPRVGYSLMILTNSLKFSNLEQNLLSINNIEPYVALTNRNDKNQENLQRMSSLGLQIEGPYGFYFVTEWRPHVLERIEAGGVLHQYEQYYVDFSLYPGEVLNYLRCDAEFGERIDVVNSVVRRGYTHGCAFRMAIGKYLEITPSAREESLLGQNDLNKRQVILSNRVFNSLVLVHFSSKVSLRYLAQEQKTNRKIAFFGEDYVPFESSRTDSLTLGLENFKGMTVYAGTSRSVDRSDIKDQIFEYFIKISSTL